MKYVRKLLRMQCYSQLHYLFYQSGKKTTKEISESYAAYFHMRSNDIIVDDYTNVHIGDGHTCRTGALFSFVSKSKNISIDPNINKDKMALWKRREKPQNFKWYKNLFQDVKLELEEPYNFVCVHAHVGLIDIDKKHPNWSYMYSNPCCMPLKQTFPTEYMYKNNIVCIFAGYDNNIESERNMVYLYKKIKGLKN